MKYYKNFLNSGRNSIRYLIRAFDIKTLHIPYYTCPSVWQAARKECCKVKFYHINKTFLPATEFNNNDFILYTNYFGINSYNVINLSKKYKNLIIDNSQAFFMEELGLAGFNSLRKFFPTVDGSYVYSKKEVNNNFEPDISYKEFENQYGKLNKSNYDLYRNRNFDINEEIKSISTQTLNQKLDYEKEKQDRLQKFEILNNRLDKYNELKIDLNPTDIPYIYPLLNTELKTNYEQYWGKQPKNSVEDYFQSNLIAIPIDFRHSIDLFRSNDFYKSILRHKRSTSSIHSSNKK